MISAMGTCVRRALIAWSRGRNYIKVICVHHVITFHENVFFVRAFSCCSDVKKTAVLHPACSCSFLFGVLRVEKAIKVLPKIYVVVGSRQPLSCCGFVDGER